MSCSFDHLPFCIGPQPVAVNPHELPNTFPLLLEIDSAVGAIQQIDTPELDNLLERAYQLGIEMGTPIADTELGDDYAQDFLGFINSAAPEKGRALEIGAGVGYISSQLIKSGWATDSIEPGKGYEKYWEKYGLNVVNDFFPTSKVKGPYDLIVFFAVIEHIFDVNSFLRSVSEYLSPDGVVVLAAPDCTIEIESGDPSMLLHEHYHYFTPLTLRRTLQMAGFKAAVQPSGFGRSIFASAKLNKGEIVDKPSQDELLMINAYPEKTKELINRFSTVLNNALEHGSVGIYCPARALSLLPHSADFRFFDDSESLQTMYYPPFPVQIESRGDLLREPVDSLLIMTRTFGKRLSEELRPQLVNTKIYIIGDDI